MKIADNIDMNTKGIYIITNLISNAVYIGCTRTTFHHRLKAHIWALKGNRHENSHLQNAYNKYGEDEFEFKLSKRFEGENSNFAKFTNDDIINIKQMLIDDVDINIIAETFNTSYKYIKSIQYHKRWKHIIIDGWNEYVDRLPHKQRITQEVKDNIYKDYQCGLSMSDIKRKYNVSYDTIKRYIK